MRKKCLINLALIFIIPGLLMTFASCSKKMTAYDSGMTPPAAMQEEMTDVTDMTDVADMTVEQPMVEESEEASVVAESEIERVAPADMMSSMMSSESVAPMMEEKPKVMTQADREAMFAMAVRQRNMFINEDVYFSLDASNLSPIARTVLNDKADWLLRNNNVKVTIEGHCDERGTSEYNLALGDRRAESVKAFLVDLNISPERMGTLSYGEEKPVDDEKNEEAWAKNRRAHFTINNY